MKKFTIVKNDSYNEIYAVIISETTATDELQNILDDVVLEAMQKAFEVSLFEILQEKLPADCTLINVVEENVITF